MKTKLIWAALCIAFALLACRQQKGATASHPRQVEGVTFSTIQNKEGNSHFEIEVRPAAGLPAEDTLAKSAEVHFSSITRIRPLLCSIPVTAFCS